MTLAVGPIFGFYASDLVIGLHFLY